MRAPVPLHTSVSSVLLLPHFSIQNPKATTSAAGPVLSSVRVWPAPPGGPRVPRWGATRWLCSGRQVLSYDVVIVGTGPAGLTAAIRLKQLCRAADANLSICVLEKGSEVDAALRMPCFPSFLLEQRCALPLRRLIWAVFWLCCWCHVRMGQVLLVMHDHNLLMVQQVLYESKEYSSDEEVIFSDEEFEMHDIHGFISDATAKVYEITYTEVGSSLRAGCLLVIVLSFC